MIDYLLAFQVFAAVYVMIAIGYGCAGIKLFDSSYANAVRKILDYVCIPGLIFHQVGIRSFTYETFKPFLIGMLTQLTIQTFILFISFIFPFESKKHKYIMLFYSCSYSDCLFACLPISQFIFGETYNYIPVMLSMVQYLIIMPIHNLITFKVLGPPTTSIDEKSSDHEYKNNEGEEINLNDLDNNPNNSIKYIPTKRIAISGENIELKSKKKSEIKQRLNDSNENDQNEVNSTSFLDEENQKKKEKNDIKSQDKNDNIDDIHSELINKSDTNENNINDKEQESLINNDDEKNAADENNSSQNKESCVQKKCPALYNFGNKFKLKNAWTTIFWSLVTPINICFILGIIWSIIGIKMPKFLSQFVTDLEKAVVAGGLFASGVFLWSHPFFGCSPIEIPLTTLVHIVILPLIGFLFCWILKAGNVVTQIIIFCLAAPSALSSFAAAIYNNCTKSTITYTFFWTYLICLPVFLLWTVLFNQTKIFYVN